VNNKLTKKNSYILANKPWAKINLFHLLQSTAGKITKDSLYKHFNHTIHSFRRNKNAIIDDLIAKMISGNYYPEPIKRIYLKDDCFDFIQYPDKIVQRVLLKIIRPTISHIVHKYCFHRHGPHGCKKAIGHVKYGARTGRYKYMMRLDIKSYYASIGHHILLKLLSNDYKDKRLLQLFKNIITADLITKKGITNPHKGIYLRSPLATFFSMIYLKPLDAAFNNMDVCYARYQDDIIILFKSKSQFYRGKRKMIAVLNDLELQLSKKKSYMGPIKDFHFLGARIIHAQRDIYHRGPTAELHPRSLVKAANRAAATVAIGSATHDVRRYLLLWATWWAQAIGDDRTTCLAALYNWSKDPLLRLQIYSTIVTYHGPSADFLPTL
jgi:RNA-directed DNA polymerase